MFFPLLCCLRLATILNYQEAVESGSNKTLTTIVRKYIFLLKS